MGTEFQFDPLTPEQVAQVVDIQQQIEALQAQLANVQNDRAASEATWSGMENDINTQINTLRVQLRDIRHVNIVVTDATGVKTSTANIIQTSLNLQR